MGLDMTMYGRTWPKSDDHEDRDGVELAYWRKHPNLHGFIVNTFAGGKDECQDLEKIVDAVNTNKLPSTRGFFFGQSDGPNDQETTQQIAKVIDWLGKSERHRVVYKASW